MLASSPAVDHLTASSQALCGILSSFASLSRLPTPNTMKFHALALLAAIAPFVAGTPAAEDDISLEPRSSAQYKVKLYKYKGCGG